MGFQGRNKRSSINKTSACSLARSLECVFRFGLDATGHALTPLSPLQYMQEERDRRDQQWNQLIGVVKELEFNIGTLPRTLLGGLRAAEAEARKGVPPVTPTMDEDNGANVHPNSVRGPLPPNPRGDARLGPNSSVSWGPKTKGTTAPSPSVVAPGDTAPTGPKGGVDEADVDKGEPPTDKATLDALKPLLELTRSMSGSDKGKGAGGKDVKEGDGKAGSGLKGPRMPTMPLGQPLLGEPSGPFSFLSRPARFGDR